MRNETLIRTSDNVGITVLGRPDDHSIRLKFESSFTGATISAHGVGVDDRIQCVDFEELQVP